MVYKDPDKQKKYQHEWYLRNQELSAQRARLNSDRSKQRNREYVQLIKIQNPCADCGGHYHPEAMHFDHTSDDKKKSIARFVGSGHSIKTIDEEIAKCDLVCANCHAVRTFNRRKLGAVADFMLKTGEDNEQSHRS